jgi:hypothetical protein
VLISVFQCFSVASRALPAPAPPTAPPEANTGTFGLTPVGGDRFFSVLVWYSVLISVFQCLSVASRALPAPALPPAPPEADTGTFGLTPEGGDRIFSVLV